jgi:hypothetical protein
MSFDECRLTLQEEALPEPPPYCNSIVTQLDDSGDSEHNKKKEKKEKKSKASPGDERRSSRSNGEEQSSRISNGEERSSRRSGEERRSSQREDSGCRTDEVASPSAVCRTRRHSPVVKSSNESTHELSNGRPVIVVPSSTTTTATNLRNSMSEARLPSLGTVKRGDSVQRSLSDVPNEPCHPHAYLTDPHPLRLDAWTEPPGTNFSVRGRHYMRDKVKSDSMPTVFRLLTVDLVKCDGKPRGLCNHPNERIQRALARERETGIRELPEFVFAVNLVLPSGNSLYHSVFYFGIDDISILHDTSTPFGKLAQKFFFGDSDAFRNETFKLIPRIVEGNFIVRKAVGSKPAILGRKIKQTYIRTGRFMELIVDVAADNIASKIVTLSLGYAKTLAVDMAFVLEGNDPTTLPEQIMAVVRMNHIDFKKRDGQRRLS